MAVLADSIDIDPGSDYSSALIVRDLGLCEYQQSWQAMQRFTNERDKDSVDELWVLQHPPVFTLGQAGKPEHVLGAGDIPVINVDRGGQVTYHGPGQLVAYPLIDLQRRQLSVRCMVQMLEQVIIDVLADYELPAQREPGKPGVYLGENKIAALGLRVRRGRSFHGLAFNVDMDLSPYSRINPCGYAGQPVIDLQRACRQLVDSADLIIDFATLQERFLRHFLRTFDYKLEFTKPLSRLPA